MGGDEFLILLPETDEQESLAAVERYLESLAQPFLVKDIPVTLEGSFGLAHYPAHGQTISDLVRLADGAMYQAKAIGGGVRVYVPVQDDAAKLPTPSSGCKQGDVYGRLEHPAEN